MYTKITKLGLACIRGGIEINQIGKRRIRSTMFIYFDAPEYVQDQVACILQCICKQCSVYFLLLWAPMWEASNTSWVHEVTM